jgi:uncharacterized membrane protein
VFEKMVKKMFEVRVSTMVVESFIMILMIALCVGIVWTLYMAAMNNNFTQLNTIIILELFQGILLLILTHVCIKLWEKHKI